MGILRVLSRILDPFRERAGDVEERKMLLQLRGMRDSEKALLAAAERGESVEEDLEETRAQAADLLSRMTRGDNPSFYTLCALSVLTLVPLGFAYRRLYPVIVEMWGGPETWAANWYLQRYRLYAAWIFRVGHFLIASIWSPVALVSLLAVLWFVQRRLQRRHARAVVRTLIYVDLLAFFSLAYAAGRLLSQPLV